MYLETSRVNQTFKELTAAVHRCQLEFNVFIHKKAPIKGIVFPIL